MSRKHHAERLPTTDDLLAGRAQPTATALLHAIHAENPTGRGLPRAQEERRYERKARLQSLLVRVHGDDLIVRADPRDEGVVTLVHRDLEADACHASIEALDDDARVWVRTRLAMGDEVERDAEARSRRERQASEAPPEEGTIEGALESAQEALDAYDYESARARLESALRAWPDDPRPAVALLELLVDVLALDDEALALQLSKRARTSLTVRRKLAIASARVALARGDVAEADAHLREAESLGPDEVAESVRAEIERVRGDARAEAERALQQALAAAGQDWQQVIARATAFLARWPDSAVARRAIREAEGHVLDAEAERARAEAEAAEARDDLDRALVVLREIGARLGDRADRRELGRALQAEAARVEAELLRRTNEARVARVAEHLAERCDADALLAYASLDASSRAAVQRRIARPELAWVEAVHAMQPRRAAIDAVLALARATEIAERSPEHAGATLAAHRAVLAEVPEAAAIFRRAEALEREARLRAVREALAAARASYEADRLDDARRAMASIRAGELDQDEREAHRALAAAIERRVARDDRVAAYRHARAGERWFDARRALDALASEHADDPGLALEAERAAVESEIARAFQVSIEHGAWPIGDGFDVFLPRTDEAPHVVLALDGDEPRFAQVDVHGPWIFARIVDVSRRVTITRVRLRAPASLEQASAWWDGHRLVVAGRGAVVVRTDDGLVEGWTAPPWSDDHVFEESTVSADGRYAWIASRTSTDEDRLDVVDVVTGRVVRQLRGWVATPVGGPAPRLSVQGPTGLIVCDGRGATLERIAGETLQRALPLPAGNGWLVVAGTGKDGEPVLLVKRGGELRALGGAASYGHLHCIAVTVGDAVLLRFGAPGADAGVLSFREQRGDEIVERARIDAPLDAPILIDAQARRAFSPWPTEERVELVELRADVALPRPAPRRRRTWPSTAAWCGGDDLDAPAVRIHARIVRGDLAGAWAALDVLAPTSELEDEREHERVHAEHLRAMIALLEGDAASAQAAIRRGGAVGRGLCAFGPLDELARFLASEASDAHPDLSRIYGAIGRADAALEAGDPAAALAALPARDGLHARDVQLLARRVAAHLAMGDRGRSPPFDVARELAAFWAAAHDRFAPVMLIPRGTWWSDRIEALARDARAWLERA